MTLKQRVQAQKSSGKIAMVRQALSILMERVELTGDDARVAQFFLDALTTRRFDDEAWEAAGFQSGLSWVSEFIAGLLFHAANHDRASGTEAALEAIKGIAEFASRFDRSLYNQILDVQIGG